MTEDETKQRIDDITAKIRAVIGNCFQDAEDYPSKDGFRLLIEVSIPDGKTRFESDDWH